MLNLKEDRDIPLILGRPSLAVGKALVDVEQGKLRLSVNEERMDFDVYEAIKALNEVNACFLLDVVDTCIGEVKRNFY